jgi:hypothetical protein
VHAFFADADGYRTHGESNILAGSADGRVCAGFTMYIDGHGGSYGKPCVNVG